MPKRIPMMVVNGALWRKCSRCGEWKAADAHFYKSARPSSRRRSEYDSACTPCRLAVVAQYKARTTSLADAPDAFVVCKTCRYPFRRERLPPGSSRWNATCPECHDYLTSHYRRDAGREPTSLSQNLGGHDKRMRLYELLAAVEVPLFPPLKRKWFERKASASPASFLILR